LNNREIELFLSNCPKPFVVILVGIPLSGKDTFLNYLKYLGLLSASEFFNSEIKDKGMVALFHKNLMETAFGKWNHYIRECLAFLKQQNHTFFYPELPAYYELVETGNKSKKYKGEIESIGMLFNFRNRYLWHISIIYL
jgi:hypothetical protein